MEIVLGLLGALMGFVIIILAIIFRFIVPIVLLVSWLVGMVLAIHVSFIWGIISFFIPPLPEIVGLWNLFTPNHLNLIEPLSKAAGF